MFISPLTNFFHLKHECLILSALRASVANILQFGDNRVGHLPCRSHILAAGAKRSQSVFLIFSQKKLISYPFGVKINLLIPSFSNLELKLISNPNL